MSNEVLDTTDDAPRRPGGRRRAARSARFRIGRRRGGARRAAREHRRAHGLPGTLGLTALGAFVPGSGYLYSGRKALGVAVLGVWLAGVAALLWYFGRGIDATLDLAFDPTRTRIAAVLLGTVLLVWAFVVLTSHRLVRHRSRPRWHTAVGWTTSLVLVAVGAAPVLVAARYAMATADTVENVLDESPNSATIPEMATEDDPWAGEKRVNVLLLGGDGGKGRTGVRTDTVILASIDTETGRTVLFSLPRNMQGAEFPEDSPLHDVYPDGYRTGMGDDAYDMLNAIYGQVPQTHPGILGDSDNEGADAVKQAVEGSLGIPVDYYLLVNLAGFQDVVDALGGITVNVNEPVAINGDTDRGIPPTGYIEPGPEQHLDGFHALWFARGRYGSDDYARMDRQRCTIDAMIDAADPSTILTRYLDILQAGEEIVYTDIPRALGKPFVKLLLKVKEGKVRSVVFRSSDQFSSADPDFDYMQDVVQKSLYPKKREPGTPKPDRPTENPVDVCAYNPVDGVETDSDLSASD
ncbi:hypothetical protein GCM10023340_35900 [Nocardioides marinquilinus]|uniref:Cell envelope-related transcriptional attenuator domain-containing protein n=2 Tax=Nocardioides marinquilinus TaxID=1210400 RepID=A0ABP9PX41_9ACTN